MQICQPKRLLSHPKDKDLPIWRHAAFVNVKAWHKGNNLNKTENVLWISIIFIQYKGAGGASETDEFSEGSKRPLPHYTPPFSENQYAIFSKFYAPSWSLRYYLLDNVFDSPRDGGSKSSSLNNPSVSPSNSF